MKPILFNTEMVQAILEGRKTCTRRIAKTIKSFEMKDNNRVFARIQTNQFTSFGGGAMSLFLEKYAPYQIGDILYVRETFFEGDILDSNEDIVKRDIVIYATDDLSEHGLEELKWKPSIHMPKKLARIFLKVTDIRIERLQDITENEAVKEGIHPMDLVPYVMSYNDSNPEIDYDELVGQEQDAQVKELIEESFGSLWDSTVNKKDIDKYGWKANPWVWVIEFEKTSIEWLNP